MSKRSIFATICAIALFAYSAVALAGSVRDKYKKGKQMQAAGQYDEAIKIFTELKALQYHPILDYRIGACHEALGKNGLAIYHFSLYMKFHGKKRWPAGKNHPTKEDANKKIQALKAKGATAAPAPTPAPGGTPPTPTPATGKPAHYGTGQPHGTPPGATAPGASGQPYDPYAYGAPPPPPPRVRRRRRFPTFRAFYITADVGYNGVAGELGKNYVGGVGAYAGLFYRPFIFLSFGPFVMANTFMPKSDVTMENLTSVIGGLEIRGHLPLRAWGGGPWYFELWGSLMGGYSYITSHREYTTGSEYDFTLQGGAVGFGIGAELYLSRWLSVGMNFRGLKAFYDEECQKGGSCFDINSTNDNEELKSDIIFYLGFSATFHFFLF